MQTLSLLKKFYVLQQRLQQQQHFNKQWLIPYLNSLEQKCSGRFNPAQYKKMVQYYALFVPVIFCGSYRKLEGKPFCPKERMRATLLGVMTPLYDDFFDESRMDADRLHMITCSPQHFAASTFEEKVFCLLHQQMRREVPSPDAYMQNFKKVLHSQLQSLKQFDPHTSATILMQITYQKSVDALQLFWQVLEPAPAWFEKLMYPAAGLMQLANDLFDVYKDIPAKMYTPANAQPDFEQMEVLFLKEAALFNHKIYQLPYAARNKEYFLFTMQCIIARGFVALQHLKKTWKKYNNDPHVSQLSRAELVCDMQHPLNLIKWFWYTKKFCRL